MTVFPTPVAHSAEVLPPDSPFRQVYSEDVFPNGNYYPSPFGRVKYWIVGPEEGRKVVFVHGVSTPSIGFKDVVRALSEKDFRVLVYDLYGRGYSEAPQVPQDANLYTVQLALLLQYISWSATDVVGFSLGGAITAAFVATFPHLVDKNVVLMASTGLLDPQIRTNPSGSHITGDQPPSGEQAKKYLEVQDEYLPGFRKAYQDSRRDGLATGMTPAFEAIGKLTDKRFLVIHGSNDRLVPYTEMQKVKKHIPQADFVTIEGGSHYLAMEEGSWQNVAEALVAFLST